MTSSPSPRLMPPHRPLASVGSREHPAALPQATAPAWPQSGRNPADQLEPVIKNEWLETDNPDQLLNDIWKGNQELVTASQRFPGIAKLMFAPGTARDGPFPQQIVRCRFNDGLIWRLEYQTGGYDPVFDWLEYVRYSSASPNDRRTVRSGHDRTITTQAWLDQARAVLDPN